MIAIHLVTKEVAIELKNCGFEYPCNFYFYEKDFPFRKEPRFSSNAINFNSTDRISIPTYDQVFMWFEYEHDLFFQPIIDCDSMEQFNIHSYRILSNVGSHGQLANIDSDIPEENTTVYTNRERAVEALLNKLKLWR